MKRSPRVSRRARNATHPKVPKPHWRKLSASAWKTDLGGHLPEVVILALSNEEFRKFHASTKTAKSYIDSRGFLKRKLIKLVFVNMVPTDNGSSWLVVISHTYESTAAVLAYQV